MLPKHLSCICLTRNKNSRQNGFEYRDYCSYLYNLSQNRHSLDNVALTKGQFPDLSSAVLLGSAATVKEENKEEKKTDKE